LKICEIILKSKKDHGETNAFKALALSQLGRASEAEESIKLALKLDIKSALSKFPANLKAGIFMVPFLKAHIIMKRL
jgi:hypothetical protein